MTSRLLLAGVISLALLPDGRTPAFQVDPLWPRPLPNGWILGSVTGVATDAQDHIWLVHRGADSLSARQEMGLATDPPGAEFCCRPAPFVLRFNQEGALAGHWGGPGEGYQWPRSPGGIAVEPAGHVWITAAGVTGTGATARRGRGAAPAPAAPRPEDAHVLKFSREGKFLLQIGKAGSLDGPDSTSTLNRPQAVAIDAAANEVYIADAGNRRIAVFDATNGTHKRHWPIAPAPDASVVRPLSCVELSKDGLVYVCDRAANRIHVFRKDGTPVKDAAVSPATRGDGAAWDVAFSSDAQQEFLYVADGQDQKVLILRRDSLEALSSFGGGGRYPGVFFGVGSIASDSKGVVYTGETYEGKRLQRFVFRSAAARRGNDAP